MLRLLRHYMPRNDEGVVPRNDEGVVPRNDRRGLCLAMTEGEHAS